MLRVLTGFCAVTSVTPFKAHSILRMSSSSSSGINVDGSLKKFAVPQPMAPACVAAATGDTRQLSSMPWQDILALDECGNTPLIWCADKGQSAALDLVLEVIEKHDASSVNTRGYLGNTALARAARGGHVDCVVSLLKASQINPNIANEKLQYALHFAAFKKHPAVVKALLDCKLVDTMVLDRKGRTPAEDTSDEAIRAMIIASRG
jgi:hypothetical protein